MTDRYSDANRKAVRKAITYAAAEKVEAAATRLGLISNKTYSKGSPSCYIFLALPDDPITPTAKVRVSDHEGADDATDYDVRVGIGIEPDVGAFLTWLRQRFVKLEEA